MLLEMVMMTKGMDTALIEESVTGHLIGEGGHLVLTEGNEAVLTMVVVLVLLHTGEKEVAQTTVVALALALGRRGETAMIMAMLKPGTPVLMERTGLSPTIMREAVLLAGSQGLSLISPSADKVLLGNTSLAPIFPNIVKDLLGNEGIALTILTITGIGAGALAGAGAHLSMKQGLVLNILFVIKALMKQGGIVGNIVMAAQVLGVSPRLAPIIMLFTMFQMGKSKVAPVLMIVWGALIVRRVLKMDIMVIILALHMTEMKVALILIAESLQVPNLTPGTVPNTRKIETNGMSELRIALYSDLFLINLFAPSVFLFGLW